jgi:tyrosyl-tRNA synthetase
MSLPFVGASEKWSRVLAALEEVPSASEAERLMKQGGFEIDSLPVGDPTARLPLDKGASYRVRIGKKKFLRIVVE